ncbi:MAG TPA: flagellar motor switch protein FliG [Myxococcales bacterium]|nr:flagellar motor switch protein FliG [Myxococcales bacterium]
MSSSIMANGETKSPEEAIDNLVEVDFLRTPAGARKAALLLTMLGEEAAKEILGTMEDVEVETLLRTANELRNISQEEAESTLSEFLQLFDGRKLLIPATGQFVRNLGQDTLGDAKTNQILGIDAPPEEPVGISAAVDASAESIAQVLRKEHPQTVAIALSAMDISKAAQVVGHLPQEHQAGIIKRIAELKTISEDVVREIGSTLRHELEISAAGSEAVDGQSLVVNLLKALNSEQEEHIFAGLSEEDPELSEEIRKKMFVFEDFVTLDGRAIQLMLKEIDSRTLTMALKTSSAPLREHLLSCMSSRAATMIIEDMEALGPLSVSQIETAQDEIVQVALRLAAEGKMSLR